MKAALLTQGRRIVVEEVPEPAADGWALVETKAAGICGTDLHFIEGILEPPNYPFVLGHEIAGVVREAPPGSAVSAGDRVAVYNNVGCGVCKWCRSERTSICTSPVGQLGITLDGGYRGLVRAPASNLVPLPDAVGFEEAAVLGCSGMTAVHATRLAEVSPGSLVVVNGVGGVGLSIVQVALAVGADVIAVADAGDKAELARELGARATIITPSGVDYAQLPDEVRTLSDGRGADFYFDLVATASTMSAGIASLGRAGCFVVVGYGTDALTCDPAY